MNGVPVNLHMMLDDNGTAFFLEGVDSDDEDDDNRTGENPFFTKILILTFRILVHS